MALVLSVGTDTLLLMHKAGVFIRETLAGKDMNRTLCNLVAAKHAAMGKVLDAGGGHGGASYWRFIQRKETEVTTVDIDSRQNPTLVLNLEQDPIPRPDNYFDTILFFNVLEHVSDPETVLKRLHVVLSTEGQLIGAVPFLVNVHPDPHDYHRFTNEGLERVFSRAGFRSLKLEVIGTGPFGAAYSQCEFLFPHVFKILVLPIVLLLDRFVTSFRPAFRDKYPLSYFFVANK